MERMELIEKITKMDGISGHEQQVSTFMQKNIHGCDEITKDKLGSIHFLFQGSSHHPKIMFLAHQDEIGFLVAEITAEGFIKMQAIGGWNVHDLMSSPVEIINRNGKKVHGVIGSIPVHFLKGNAHQIEMENLFIDIGAANREEVEKKF
jgi:putative aminopeptidase FrvX